MTCSRSRQDTTAVRLGAPQPAELLRGDRELGTSNPKLLPFQLMTMCSRQPC